MYCICVACVLDAAVRAYLIRAPMRRVYKGAYSRVGVCRDTHMRVHSPAYLWYTLWNLHFTAAVPVLYIEFGEMQGAARLFENPKGKRGEGGGHPKLFSVIC